MVSRKMVTMLVTALIAGGSGLPQAEEAGPEVGVKQKDSVFGWGRWRILAPVPGETELVGQTPGLREAARPEDAVEYERVAEIEAAPVPTSVPLPTEETGPVKGVPEPPPAWEGCQPGALCVYATYAYEISNWTEENTDGEHRYGSREPAWLDIDYEIENPEADDGVARGRFTVRPWVEEEGYETRESVAMEGDFEREAMPPAPEFEVELDGYQASDHPGAVHDGESYHDTWSTADFDTEAQPSAGPDAPPFLIGRWTWSEARGDLSAEATAAGSWWDSSTSTYGAFRGGVATSLDRLNGLASNGVVARYGGEPVFIDVDFGAATWSGSWFGGRDAPDPLFGTRFAEVYTDDRGVRTLEGISMGFEARGHIDGVNLISDEVTAKDAESISGSVRGSFLGEHADAIAGVVDVTKTVTPESAGRPDAFTYENARSINVFLMHREGD